MVDMIDFAKKIFNKVGLEVIAIIGVILAVQQLTGIDLNLDMVIYILVLVAFIDALIKMALSMYETIRLKVVAVNKKCKEYGIAELEKETSQTISQKGLELVKEIREDIKDTKLSRSEKKEIKKAEKEVAEQLRIEQEREIKKKELEAQLAELIGSASQAEDDQVE